MFALVMFVLGALNGHLWTFVTLDPEQLNKINSQCIANQGIEKAVVEVALINVYCKDGAKFRLKD